MRVLIPLLAVFLTGCSLSTSQRVGIAAEAVVTTNNSMTVLARSGLLDLETADDYEYYRKPVQAYLDIAIEDILDGDDDNSSADSALDLLVPLLDRMIEIEREKSNE